MTRGDTEHLQIGDIQSTVHHLDKRVTVLETRADAQAEQIGKVSRDVQENKNLSMQILETMYQHREEDSRERSKVFRWTVATLAGVVLSLFTALFNL